MNYIKTLDTIRKATGVQDIRFISSTLAGVTTENVFITPYFEIRYSWDECDLWSALVPDGAECPEFDTLSGALLNAAARLNDGGTDVGLSIALHVMCRIAQSGDSSVSAMWEGDSLTDTETGKALGYVYKAGRQWRAKVSTHKGMKCVGAQGGTREQARMRLVAQCEDEKRERDEPRRVINLS